MARTVKCIKLGREAPGMKWKPFEDDLGNRLFASVSQEGWQQWLEHSKMLINEYRLDLQSQKAQSFLHEQCESFFFGDGGKPPPEFVKK